MEELALLDVVNGIKNIVKNIEIRKVTYWDSTSRFQQNILFKDELSKTGQGINTLIDSGTTRRIFNSELHSYDLQCRDAKQLSSAS